MAEPTIIDLEDPYFDGQTLPEALADYNHVHSTTGICVKNTRGPYCSKATPPRHAPRCGSVQCVACYPEVTR